MELPCYLALRHFVAFFGQQSHGSSFFATFSAKPRTSQSYNQVKNSVDRSRSKSLHVSKFLSQKSRGGCLTNSLTLCSLDCELQQLSCLCAILGLRHRWPKLALSYSAMPSPSLPLRPPYTSTYFIFFPYLHIHGVCLFESRPRVQPGAGRSGLSRDLRS
jgi:hypothetical protein